ncbi:MAG: AAA family ATPase, partial [Clostridia bacterium]|nr:AAA family ATPase [Clostridia bacterium]
MNQNFLQRIEIDWNLIPYGSYLHKIDAIREIESLNFDSPVTFFVGENGTGKSTLIEAIAVAYGFNAEGGSLNYNFST